MCDAGDTVHRSRLVLGEVRRGASAGSVDVFLIQKTEILTKEHLTEETYRAGIVKVILKDDQQQR